MIALFKDIALPTIAIAINCHFYSQLKKRFLLLFAIAFNIVNIKIVERAITLWEHYRKEAKNQCTKPIKKNDAKILRVTTLLLKSWTSYN